jgi:hypothetical protein
MLTQLGSQTVSNKDLTSSTNTFPFKGGTNGITTNASGQATITHGLGATPAWVNITTTNTSAYFAALYAKTATTFTVQINNATAGGVLVSGPISITWSAGLF